MNIGVAIEFKLPLILKFSPTCSKAACATLEKLMGGS